MKTLLNPWESQLAETMISILFPSKPTLYKPSQRLYSFTPLTFCGQNQDKKWSPGGAIYRTNRRNTANYGNMNPNIGFEIGTALKINIHRMDHINAWFLRTNIIAKMAILYKKITKKWFLNFHSHIHTRSHSYNGYETVFMVMPYYEGYLPPSNWTCHIMCRYKG